jgi:hypothetical protein
MFQFRVYHICNYIGQIYFEHIFRTEHRVGLDNSFGQIYFEHFFEMSTELAWIIHSDKSISNIFFTLGRELGRGKEFNWK